MTDCSEHPDGKLAECDVCGVLICTFLPCLAAHREVDDMVTNKYLCAKIKAIDEHHAGHLSVSELVCNLCGETVCTDLGCLEFHSHMSDDGLVSDTYQQGLNKMTNHIVHRNDYTYCDRCECDVCMHKMCTNTHVYLYHRDHADLPTRRS